MLERLPPEILIKVFNKVTYRDRARSALVCKEFFEMISTNYINSTYGKLYTLNDFLSHELNRFVNDIEKYRRSQAFKYTHFSPCPQRQNGRRTQLKEPIINTSLFTASLCLVLGLYSTYSNNPFDFSFYIASLIFFAKYVLDLASKCGLHIYNKCLDYYFADQPVDEHAVENVQKLIRKHGFFSGVSDLKPADGQQTFKQIEQLLDSVKDTVSLAVDEFKIYHDSTVSLNLESINLNKIAKAPQSKSKVLLKFFIEKWNDYPDVINNKLAISLSNSNS
jgi:hypothetical protein